MALIAWIYSSMCAHFKPSKISFISHDMCRSERQDKKGHFKKSWKRLKSIGQKTYLYYAIKCEQKIRSSFCLWGNIQNSFPGTLFLLIFFTKVTKKTFFYIYFASSLNFTLLPRSLLVCYYFYFSSFFPFFFPTLHRTPLISKSLKSSAFFRNCILFAFFLLSCTAFMLKRAPRC